MRTKLSALLLIAADTERPLYPLPGVWNQHFSSQIVNKIRRFSSLCKHNSSEPNGTRRYTFNTLLLAILLAILFPQAVNCRVCRIVVHNGNENWELDEPGYMKGRFVSINDLPINASERKFLWERKA